eukprot:1999068-Rhodomonas_salina.1
MEHWPVKPGPWSAQAEVQFEVSLASCGIGPQAGPSVWSLIAEFTGVVRMALSSNELADVGAGRLAAALASCRKLQRLDVADNAIGEDGAGKLL